MREVSAKIRKCLLKADGLAVNSFCALASDLCIVIHKDSQKTGNLGLNLCRIT